MLGWNEIITSPESDQLVHDPCTSNDGILIGWSDGLLDVEAVIQELALATDVHHNTGWLFAG